MTEGWIPDEDWRTIVEHVPIVSVDLLVVKADRILLGKRQNEPAKGEWFVPGGRVQKGETRQEAVHRVARDELGMSVDIRDSLGSYEHFYDVSESGAEGGKHYLANGYVVEPVETDATVDDQHEIVRWFSLRDLPDLHKYVQDYIHDSNHVVR